MLLPDAPVSIDIGSSAVKVAQLRGGRSGVRAIRFGEQPLPEGFHWQLGADISPLVETIRRAMRNAGIRSRRAIIAVPRRHVTARISAFPPSDRAQMARVVKYDLADHIPFPVEQVVADFQPLGPSLEQPGMTDVLVVAAQRDLVMQYLELARALGMRLSALTVDSFALHDLATLRDEGEPGICLSLELGKRASLIGVSQGKRLRLTRSVPFGSYQLALALRDDLGLTLEEAEQRVQSQGLEVLAGTPRPNRVAAWLDNLRGEMQRSALSFGQAGISHIYLAGAAARTPGLAKAIETEFSLAPALLSPASLFPTAQLQGTSELVAERCLLAIGQGLRGLGRSAFSISLVPEEVGTERRGALTKRLVAVASVALLALLAWSYQGAKGYVAEQQVQVATLTKKAVEAKGNAEDAARVMERRDALRGELTALAPVRARRYAALELLKAVSAGSSGQVILTHFAMRPEQPLVLRGTAPDSAAAADLQAKLSDFRLVTRASLDRVDLIEQSQLGAGARGYRPPAPAATPASADRVDFIMTVHLWTEKQARVRRVFSSRAGGVR